MSKRFSLKDGEKLHTQWVYAHRQTTYIVLAIASYLLVVVAVPADSVARDFTLLFGILGLVGLGHYRERNLTRVILGQVWIAQKKAESSEDDEAPPPSVPKSSAVGASQRVPPHGS